MANIQSEGSQVRVQPGAKVDLILNIPTPQALYSVLPPPGIRIKESKSGLTRKFRFTAPPSPWSGTFVFAFAFIPGADGEVDSTEKFRLSVDDPATATVDLDVSTISPRSGNPNPIPFILDFVA